MAEQIITPIQHSRTGNVFSWLLGIVCFGSLVYILVATTIQIVIPPPAHRLTLLRDIPLPSALPAKFIPFAKDIPHKEDPLAPGVSVRFDHFDFQTFDPLTGLLFIAHTGPQPGKFAPLSPSFSADKNSSLVDGHVIVFDTRRNKVVGRVNIPQIAGIVVAPDHHQVYATDANDSTVFAIDEQTLKATAIPLGNNEGPDEIEYDQTDQKLFVSDVGTASPDIINPKNQNIAVIDIQTNSVTKINIGGLPLLPGESTALAKFGYSIGHNHYDPVLRRLFVPIQQLTDQVGPKALNPPPPGTGELVSIDPISQSVVGRLQLPKTCGIPHGMAIDADQHMAFIACTEADPADNIVQNLVSVDIQSMSVISILPSTLTLAGKPDMVVFDRPLHIVLVGCVGGVSVFDESGGHLRKLSNYILGPDTHTLAIDEKTQLVYMPLPDIGGRPTLRIARFNPNGV